MRYPAIATVILLLGVLGLGNGQRFVSPEMAKAIPMPPQPRPISAAKLCPHQVAEGIAAIADRPQFRRGHWGILVQVLGTGDQVYARNADQFFTPASTAKLFTTAAALESLGPGFRWRTTVYGRGEGAGRRLTVVGQGDPSLRQAQLDVLAEQLYRQGIRQVETLAADDSYFQGSLFSPTWEWEDLQYGYGAPVNSLIVDQNAIAVIVTPQAIGQPLSISFVNPHVAKEWRVENTTRTVGSDQPEVIRLQRQNSILSIGGQLQAGAAAETVDVAVVNPTQHFLLRFRQALESHQIQIGQTQILGQILDPPGLDGGKELAGIASPPLAEILPEINQNSNNLYAEALLKTLGVRQNPAPDATAQGLIVVKATLTRLGVDPQSYQLVDGSGLSRRNLVSPIALVQVLQAMHRGTNAIGFRNSLAVAGVSGTLKGRLAETQLVGKTGTLTDALSLSGYLSPPDFSPLVLAIIVNQSGQPNLALRQAIDEMVVLLNRIGSCPLNPETP
jgi:serine-type D-Ala-D-Ala carboxypeptidase/endopeptidase (penicillin-binding protein 4)